MSYENKSKYDCRYGESRLMRTHSFVIVADVTQGAGHRF